MKWVSSPSTALHPAPPPWGFTQGCCDLQGWEGTEFLLTRHKCWERPCGQGSSFTSLTQHTYTSVFQELYFVKPLTAQGVVFPVVPKWSPLCLQTAKRSRSTPGHLVPLLPALGQYVCAAWWRQGAGGREQREHPPEATLNSRPPDATARIGL